DIAGNAGYPGERRRIAKMGLAPEVFKARSQTNPNLSMLIRPPLKAPAGRFREGCAEKNLPAD
ncbi:MAG TPA: hypothetical protein VLT92_13025, partial [Burkholderiales bacterium]|nr:hypothetical protein [Burkholderiales bacterium]